MPLSDSFIINLATDLIFLQGLFILGAYLSGSICSAIPVCKLMRLPDPRHEGSLNPGATNVLRIGGRKAAAFTLVGDMLKGVIPVLLTRLFDMPLLTTALAASAVFLGHLYPVFFGFHGGKGVATLLGVLLGIHWMLGLAAAGTWLFVARIVKVSSIAAMVMATLAPAYSWFFFHDPVLFLILAAMSILLFWRHRNNIHNLLGGSEGKITVKAADTGESKNADNG